MKSEAFTGPCGVTIYFEGGPGHIFFTISKAEIEKNSRDQFLSLIENRIENARRDHSRFLCQETV